MSDNEIVLEVRGKNKYKRVCFMATHEIKASDIDELLNKELNNAQKHIPAPYMDIVGKYCEHFNISLSTMRKKKRGDVARHRTRLAYILINYTTMTYSEICNLYGTTVKRSNVYTNTKNYHSSLQFDPDERVIMDGVLKKMDISDFKVKQFCVSHI